MGGGLQNRLPVLTKEFMENEIDRIKKYYAERDSERMDWAGNSKGGIFYRAVRFISHSKEDAFFEVLGKSGFKFDTFPKLVMLDVGCGDGNLLASFVRYGANPKNLYGIDLMPNRVFEARDILPEANLRSGNAERLPYGDISFHITTMFTMLSAIKDKKVRLNVINEVKRVSDAIVIFDFFRSVNNKHEQPVLISELKEWFSDYVINYKTIIPQFGVLSKVINFSPMGAKLLENCKFLNTHFLAVIKRR